MSSSSSSSSRRFREEVHACSHSRLSNSAPLGRASRARVKSLQSKSSRDTFVFGPKEREPQRHSHGIQPNRIRKSEAHSRVNRAVRTERQSEQAALACFALLRKCANTIRQSQRAHGPAERAQRLSREQEHGSCQRKAETQLKPRENTHETRDSNIHKKQTPASSTVPYPA